MAPKRPAMRVIVDVAGRPPWWQMALDEAILEGVAGGGSPPTLRLYVFSPSSVSIGLFQRLEDAVNLEEAERLGIPVVRRFTGGGSVYHDEDGELTYSIALPARGAFSGVEESYRVICTALAEALRALGVDAQYSPPNDIVVRGRKVSGNAQARRRGALLQHGTILYNTDLDMMERLLRAPAAKLRSHGAGRLRDRVTTLSRELGRRVALGELARLLAEELPARLGFEAKPGWYSLEELELAARLKEKYRSREWLRRR